MGRGTMRNTIFLIAHLVFIQQLLCMIQPLPHPLKNPDNITQEIIEQWLNAGGNINEKYDNKTLLHFAVEKNNLDLVRYLLQQPSINIDEKEDTLESTALHIATYNGNMAIVEKLITKNADVNIADIRNSTPLHEVIKGLRINPSDEGKSTRKKMINLLLEYEANPNLQDEEGSTPAHLALSTSKEWEKLIEWCTSVIKLLIPKITNIDVFNNQKETVLSLATVFDMPELVEALLEKGADPFLYTRAFRPFLTSNQEIKDLFYEYISRSPTLQEKYEKAFRRKWSFTPNLEFQLRTLNRKLKQLKSRMTELLENFNDLKTVLAK